LTADVATGSGSRTTGATGAADEATTTTGYRR